MASLDRRSFLRSAVKVGGAAALAPSLAGLAACNDAPVAPGPQLHRGGIPRAGRGFGGYGPLAVSPDVPELLIPEGFNVVKLSTTFQPSLVDPSYKVPAAVDGMAAFAISRDRIRLVRNHEVRDGAGIAPTIGPNPYDATAGGGTSTLEVRVLRERGNSGPHGHGRGGRVAGVELLKEFSSISGTFVNCAGGPTSWGSWLTCEETVAGTAAGFAMPHGYVFDVPARANHCVEAVPIKDMGRFSHEAIAMDFRSGLIYETEDQSFNGTNLLGSGFYRFIPDHGSRLHRGGKLQLLAVVGADNYNATRDQTVGQILPVRWVDIADPDPANTESDPFAVLRQGLELGGAFFQRLEGCWYGDNSIFFNATSGGNAGSGQVWQYKPRGSFHNQLRGEVAGTLSLIFESPGSDVLDSPDNITVSPRGGLVLCEDGDDVQFMRGLTQRGEIFDLVQTNGNLTEFAGATFSEDGDVLFFNMQGSTSALGTNPGFTFAMFGPWEEGALG